MRKMIQFDPSTLDEKQLKVVEKMLRRKVVSFNFEDRPKQPMTRKLKD